MCDCTIYNILVQDWEQWVLLLWRWPFPGVLVLCLSALFKCLTEATWKGKSLFWLPVPGETVHHGRETGQQEEEVTGYVASTVRKQRTQMLVFRQPSLLCLVQNSFPWKGTSHIYFGSFHTSIHSLTDKLTVFLHGDSHPTKLTIKINYHIRFDLWPLESCPWKVTNLPRGWPTVSDLMVWKDNIWPVSFCFPNHSLPSPSSLRNEYRIWI